MRASVGQMWSRFKIVLKVSACCLNTCESAIAWRHYDVVVKFVVFCLACLRPPCFSPTTVLGFGHPVLFLVIVARPMSWVSCWPTRHSILLLSFHFFIFYFLPPNFGGHLTNRYQTLPHVHWWAVFISIGQKFRGSFSEKKLMAQSS